MVKCHRRAETIRIDLRRPFEGWPATCYDNHDHRAPHRCQSSPKPHRWPPWWTQFSTFQTKKKTIHIPLLLFYLKLQILGHSLVFLSLPLVKKNAILHVVNELFLLASIFNHQIDSSCVFQSLSTVYKHESIYSIEYRVEFYFPSSVPLIFTHFQMDVKRINLEDKSLYVAIVDYNKTQWKRGQLVLYSIFSPFSIVSAHTVLAYKRDYDELITPPVARIATDGLLRDCWSYLAVEKNCAVHYLCLVSFLLWVPMGPLGCWRACYNIRLVCSFVISRNSTWE